MIKINSFNELLKIDWGENSWQSIIFDVDKTISKGEVICSLFDVVLKEFGLGPVDLEKKLGKVSFLETGWIRSNLSVNYDIATKIIKRYKTLFFQLPENDFKNDLYDDVYPFFQRLYKKNIKIGIFTLRHYEMAIQQINKNGLAKFVSRSELIPNNVNKKITGSGLQIGNSPQLAKKRQLEMHIRDTSDISNEKVLVIGDSLETDIEPAMQLKLGTILINRG